MGHLADDKLAFRIIEVVYRNLEVERSGTLADTARDIIMRTMAWAEPSSEIARLANGHASQVGANAEHDEPLRFLDTGVVRLGITEALPVYLTRLADLVLRAVPNEHGLAAPLDDRVLALRYARELDFDLGQRQYVRRGGHRTQKLGHARLGDGGGEHAHGAYHEVGQGAVPGGRGGLVRAHVWYFGRIAARSGRVNGALVGVERSARRDSRERLVYQTTR